MHKINSTRQNICNTFLKFSSVKRKLNKETTMGIQRRILVFVHFQLTSKLAKPWYFILLWRWATKSLHYLLLLRHLCPTQEPLWPSRVKCYASADVDSPVFFLTSKAILKPSSISSTTCSKSASLNCREVRAGAPSNEGKTLIKKISLQNAETTVSACILWPTHHIFHFYYFQHRTHINHRLQWSWEKVL